MNDLGLYILDGKTPVREDDLLIWGHWREYANRHVAQTHVGPFWVSTVFLGIDHNFFGKGPPILFETMIQGGEPTIGLGGWDMEGWQDYQKRYATWEEAEAGHARAVEWARHCVTVVDLGLEVLWKTGEKSK